jgi:membrane associated rhomboid family serine protease
VYSDSPVSARGWLLVATLLGAGSALSLMAPAAVLDWQPGLAASEPWRAVTAAWVHWSALHLGANALGLLLVAALGVVGGLGWRWGAAWALAWPLTQCGLLLRPELLHYGGMSGVLHAGVAVAVVGLWIEARSHATAAAHQRGIGAAIGAGLALKIGLEAPWGPALRHGEGWDIAVAPFAHLSGAVAGLLCALGVAGWVTLVPVLTRRRQSARSAS